MTLKYLIVSMIVLALGSVAPVTAAKGHHGHGKSHEQHEKRHHNKHLEEGGRRELIRAEEHHDKHRRSHKHGQDCDDNCGMNNHPPKAVMPAPLPQPPTINIIVPPMPHVNIPSVPKVNTSMPHHPVDELIDNAAGDAKQKTREMLSK